VVTSEARSHRNQRINRNAPRQGRRNRVDRAPPGRDLIVTRDSGGFALTRFTTG
jgi:hypothetical protein